MTGSKKTGTIDDFRTGKYDIMVANGRLISRGYNLQNSHQMLFYDNTASLEDRLQLEGRIFRIGQDQACVYTDYVTKGTVEDLTLAALRQKKQLLDYIRGASIEELLNAPKENFAQAAERLQ